MIPFVSFWYQSFCVSWISSIDAGIFHNEVASMFSLKPLGFIARITLYPKSCWYIYPWASNCFQVCKGFGFFSNFFSLSAYLPVATLPSLSSTHVLPFIYACA